MKIHGSCHCGAISFTALVDPQKVLICHCADCQKLHGNAFALFAAFLNAAFGICLGCQLYPLVHRVRRIST